MLQMKLSDERKEKIRRTMKALWSNPKYRAMVTEAIRNAWSLPPMTETQRKIYEKLRRAGAMREQAIIEALSFREEGETGV